MGRIFVAGHEPTVASFVAKGLRAHGFTATVAETGDAAVAAARSGQFDLLLLDLYLGGKQGTAVLDELRDARVNIPIIVLTAKDRIDEILANLPNRGDDFLTKPFCFDEMLARVRLRLRGDRVAESTMLLHGALELDLRGRRARLDGRPLGLTPREFLLAETFVRNPGRVLSRQQLLSHVWGYGHDNGSNVVDVYVCGLRRKLGPGLITTVRGMGYRLEEADDQVRLSSRA